MSEPGVMDLCVCRSCGDLAPDAIKEIDRLKSALTKAEGEARRYASSYPRSSDGWNTFLMLADRIAEIAGEGNPHAG